MCIVSTVLPSKVQKLDPGVVVQDIKFLAALDCNETSAQEAMHIVAPALSAMGMEIKDLTLSVSSIYRSWWSTQQQMGYDIRASSQLKIPLIIHLNSKLLNTAYRCDQCRSK